MDEKHRRTTALDGVHNGVASPCPLALGGVDRLELRTDARRVFTCGQFFSLHMNSHAVVNEANSVLAPEKGSPSHLGDRRATTYC